MLFSLWSFQPLPPPGVTSGRANIRYPVNHFSSMAGASPQQQQPPVKKIKTLNPSMGLSAPPENEPDPDPPAAVSAPENDIPIPARAPEKVAVRSPVLVKAKGPEGKQFHLNLSEESSDDETDGKGEKVKKVMRILEPSTK